MKLIINKDRSVIQIGTWGTKNENDFEIVDFEFPEELEGYNKRIVYLLGGGDNPWDVIIDNKAYITNEITSKENVKGYVLCTKENPDRPADTDFRSREFDMPFYENEPATGLVPTPVQVDGFNTMLTTMNAKIDEVDALEQTIETAEAQRQEAEATRVSNENTRESNESTRQENEQTRQTQEADRERRTNEAIGNIEDKTAEYNANAEAKTTAFNQNATQKTNEFNSNYTQKVNDFNANATSKTNEFNSNASSKTTTFNDNATSKTNTFNSNASSKTTDFNTNAENKTSAFNTNASDKTTAFDNNASSKTSDFNTNAESKTNTFNDNATQKTTDFNNNAQAKTDAFDEHTAEITADIEELQQEVEELRENMPWNTTEQATEISVDDAAKYSKNKLELFGNTEQDNTKMTYKCDGTETGDYYLTYNSIDYYFTMPTITEGDILVFDTTDLKLYLADTVITTESIGTGTNLTFISSPNPNYPQDIHVVTGNNSVGVQGENLFDKNKVTIYSGYFSAAGVINGKGTNNSPNKWFYISCKPNTTYKITKPVTPVLSNNRFRIGTTASIPNNNSTLDDFWMEPDGSTVTQHVITTSNNAKYLCVYYGSNPDVWSDKILAVLDGLIISYFSSYPINLGNIELCKIGGKQDYLYKENGNWYKYEEFQKHEFTTGHSWPSATGNHYYWKFTPTPAHSKGYMKGYIYDSRISGFNDMPNYHFGFENNGVFHIKNLSANGREAMRDILVNANEVLYYVKATPTSTQITDETLIAQLDEIYEHLKLVKGTNNISITASDLKPYMELSYMQDLPAKLDNLDSRLALLE